MILKTLTRMSAYHFLSQKDNLIALWRPREMFGASCLDIEGLEDTIRSLNAASRDAPFKASSLRERGLIMADWHRFGQWLMQQKDITTKKCNQEMDRLYLRRWAIWHVMGSPEAMVPKEKSMSPFP